MMPLQYRQEAATQAAARLLKLRGGEMSYMKLLKLLYLADRKALLQHGRPITYDRYQCMKHGPVLRETYDLITSEEMPGQESYWRRYISEPEHFLVKLLRDAPNSELSPAQEEVLEEVFAEYGALGRWEVVSSTHKLPEWSDPRGAATPISIEDLLRAAGVGDDEIREIQETLEAEQALADLIE